MEKYGFIYIWRDKKNGRMYIGCHWGSERDGYICSSNMMRDAYSRRPHDFRRKVVQRVYTSRSDLLEAEYKWLQLIPEEELGRKFYNKSKHHFGHWSVHDGHVGTRGTKIINDGNVETRIPKDADIPEGWSLGRSPSLKEKMRQINVSEETKEKLRATKLGSRLPDEVKDKMSKSQKGRKHSEETRRRMSESRKKAWTEKRDLLLEGNRKAIQTRSNPQSTE
jgi:hypothetical protein